jgi:hypothetical protein
METIKLIGVYGYVWLSATWIILLSIALGTLPYSLLRVELRSTMSDCMRSMWTGYVLLIALEMGLNLFIPINYFCLAILLSVAATGVFLCRTTLYNFYRTVRAVHILVYCAAGAITLAWARTSHPGDYAFDMYNYHFQMVFHANNYPAIKGIFNLFSHYGNVYSPIYHAALLNLTSFPSLFGDRLSSAGMFAVLYTMLYMAFLTVLAFINHYLSEPNTTFRSLFSVSFVLVLFLLFAGIPFTLPYITNGTDGLRKHVPDACYYILSLVYVIVFLDFYRARSRRALIAVIGVAVCLIFLKLSSAILVLTIFSFVAILYLVGKMPVSLFVCTLLFWFAVSIPYILTSVQKTGALLFPISFTDIGLSWSNQQDLKTYVYHVNKWARNPHIDLELYDKQMEFWSFAWLRSWLALYSPVIVFYIGVYSVSIIAFMYGAWPIRAESWRQCRVVLSALVAVWLTSFIYWFLLGPDIRFIGSILLLPAASCVALGITLSILSNKMEHSVVICLAFSCMLAVMDFRSWLLVGGLGCSIPLAAGLSPVRNALAWVRGKYGPRVRKNGAALVLCFTALLVMVNMNMEDLKRPIRVMPIANEPTPIIWKGVRAYQAKWDPDYLCGTTTKQPCVMIPDARSTWVDPEDWTKGVVLERK